MTGETVQVHDLSHDYLVEDHPVTVLHAIKLLVPAGTAVAIVGPSGSGKSTLLSVLAGLQRPTSGSVRIGSTEMTTLTEPDLLRLRATRLAVVVQNPARNLLPWGSSQDNLRFAQRAPRSHGVHNLPEPHQLLHDLGLAPVARTRSDRLSGGERQRLALAAALAIGPGVLLVDEPTSQLDTRSRDTVATLLADIATRRGVTVIAVTHDPAVADALGRTVRIESGHLRETAACD